MDGFHIEYYLHAHIKATKLDFIGYYGEPFRKKTGVLHSPFIDNSFTLLQAQCFRFHQSQ